jgi:hypothetical protein
MNQGEKNNENIKVNINNKDIIDNNTYVVTESNDIYKAEPIFPFIPIKSLDKNERLFEITGIKFDNIGDAAYIHDGLFFIKRGEISDPDCYKHSDIYKPGFYKNAIKGETEITSDVILIKPTTEYETKIYDYMSHRSSTADSDIINVLKTKDTIFVAVPEEVKLFAPDVKNTDDILKRAIKRALMTKNIDIDLYKDRFTDKNAYLNFKQNIKGDSRLSMLLFERGCDVLNLKFTVILEELSDDQSIGLRLNSPIIVKSDETFEQ